jgi:hypothetical protein
MSQEDPGWEDSDAEQLRHDIGVLWLECLATLRRGDGLETWRELEARIAQLQARLHTMARVGPPE